MNTSGWVYVQHQGNEKALPSTSYSVPVSADLGTSAKVVDIGCDAAAVFHVPAHLEGEVVAWLADQGLIDSRQQTVTPAPDLQHGEEGGQG